VLNKALGLHSPYSMGDVAGWVSIWDAFYWNWFWPRHKGGVFEEKWECLEIWRFFCF